MINFKKKSTILLLLLGILISLIGGSIVRMNAFEKSKMPIELSSKTEKSVVFYRDDCSECQSIFPLLYYHNLFKNDLVFVNMNQPLNRRYIQKYNLKSVPTIVKNDEHYSGTNKKKIRQLIHSKF